MNRLRVYLVLALVLGMSVVSLAQTTSPSPTPDPAQDEKQKKLDGSIVKMLDQAISDAGGLKLAENRAIVYGLAGDIYWKYDPKRARELFRNSAADMITYNGEAEKARLANTDNGPRFMAFDPMDPRTQILPIIAQHDAALALELFYQTRPPAVAAALAKSGGTNISSGTGGGRGGRGGGGPAGNSGFGGFGSGFGGGGRLDPDSQMAAMENALEQRLIYLAADTDPDLATKAIKDNLSNGVSTGVIPLLQKLAKSDDKKAADIGSDVIKKVTDGDLASNAQDMNTALGFLQYAANPATSTGSSDKPFVFDASQVKDLANKVISGLTQMPKTQQTNNLINRALATLQKILPDKASVLSQQLGATSGASGGRGGMGSLYNSSTTPEDILSSMSTMTPQQKSAAMGALESKISQITDDSRAQKLIDQIPDDNAKQTAQEKLNDQKTARATAAGNLDAARQMIGNLSNKHEQVKALIALAVTFQARGTDKDLENARATMAQAKGMVNTNPEDEDDLADLMEVVKGYAVVDPDTAFRLFEPIVDEFNNVVQASAVLSKYNKRDRSFSKGELVMRINGGPTLLPFRYIGHMQALGKADFDRMSALADHFSRSDARTIVRLYILQGATRDDKKAVTTIQTPTAPPPPAT